MTAGLRGSCYESSVATRSGFPLTGVKIPDIQLIGSTTDGKGLPVSGPFPCSRKGFPCASERMGWVLLLRVCPGFWSLDPFRGRCAPRSVLCAWHRAAAFLHRYSHRFDGFECVSLATRRDPPKRRRRVDHWRGVRRGNGTVDCSFRSDNCRYRSVAALSFSRPELD